MIDKTRQCSEGSQCSYSHSDDEVQVTAGSLVGESEQEGGAWWSGDDACELVGVGCDSVTDIRYKI